jgi:hypothetical protein
LILEKYATLQEIRTVYTIDDIMEMNALLDMKKRVESIMMETKPKPGKGLK